MNYTKYEYFKLIVKVSSIKFFYWKYLNKLFYIIKRRLFMYIQCNSYTVEINENWLKLSIVKIILLLRNEILLYILYRQTIHY